MLFFIFVSSAHINFNINNFVDVILDLRKWYSAATVIFAHPGDEYGDYGGKFEISLKNNRLKSDEIEKYVIFNTIYNNMNSNNILYYKMRRVTLFRLN